MKIMTKAVFACAACAGFFMTSCPAADLPWIFEGDVSRTGRSVEVADSGAIADYQSWTKVAEKVVAVLAKRFSSARLGMILILR